MLNIKPNQTRNNDYQAAELSAEEIRQIAAQLSVKERPRPEEKSSYAMQFGRDDREDESPDSNLYLHFT